MNKIEIKTKHQKQQITQSTIPKYQQEKLLIEGVFGMCLGLQNEVFQLTELNQMKLTNTIDLQHQRMLNRLLPMAKCYLFIESYLLEQHQSMTEQAFCQGIIELRNDYINQICSIEKQSNDHGI